jgi:ribosome biogenesis GTPase
MISLRSWFIISLTFLATKDWKYWPIIKLFTKTLVIPCYEVSALEGTNMGQVQDLLKDKVTLFSGHSGVGKSSLINALLPDLELRTSEVSEWSDKGTHTTTFAEMFELPQGGFIIDTPGIRELGVIDIEKHELGRYFPEMRSRMHNCKL